MEQESTVCKHPPAPFQMEQLPPSEAPAGPWAELGPQKPMSAGCTMPSNHNRGLELNLLCTASKNPAHTAIVRVIPPIASVVCMGHGAVSRAQVPGEQHHGLKRRLVLCCSTNRAQGPLAFPLPLCLH